jgi:hypothetical protein
MCILVGLSRRRGRSALRTNALKQIGAQLAKISHPRQGLRQLEQKTAGHQNPGRYCFK